jgi:hypothetical protein
MCRIMLDGMESAEILRIILRREQDHDRPYVRNRFGLAISAVDCIAGGLGNAPRY